MGRIVKPGRLRGIPPRNCTMEQLSQAVGSLHAAILDIDNAPIVMQNDIIAYAEPPLSSSQRVAGPLMYAVADSFPHPPALGNGFVGVVVGRPCKNKHGDDAAVKPEIFFVRGKPGQQYAVAPGDVFAYLFDVTGDRIVVMDALDETGGSGGGGNGQPPIYLHGGSQVGQQPKLDFIDATTLTWAVAEDAPNDKVTLSGTAKQTYKVDDVTIATTSTLNLKAGSNISLSGSESGGIVSITINSTASGGGGSVDFEHNGSLIVTSDTLNFDDTEFETWTVTDDGGKCSVELTVAMKYGKAKHNWEKDAGDGLGYFVYVKELTSYNGSEIGDEFKVYFRGGTHHQHPNVVKDDIVMYFRDVDGRYVTFGGWDLAIGSVIDWSLAWGGGGLPKGWAIQNGSENATSSGGSGIDWHTDAGDEITTAEAPPIYFAPTDSPLAPGNSLRPVGDNTLSHFHTVLVDPASTGIDVTVDAHPDHVHPVGCATTSKKIANDNVEDYYGIVSLNDLHQPSGLVYTGKQQADSTTHGSSPHTAITLDHNVSVNDPGHGHTGTALPTYQPVHYKSLIKIERIDNSRQKAGN